MDIESDYTSYLPSTAAKIQTEYQALEIEEEGMEIA